MICAFLPTCASAAWSNNYTLTGNQAQDIVNVAVAQAGKNGQDLNYNVAWCAYFVYDCAKRANVNGIPHEGVASSMFRKATQNGLEGNYFTDVTSQNSSWTGGNGGGMQRNYDTQYCSGMNSSNWTPQMGDLVFFTRKGTSTIYHVGIVQNVSGNTIYVVHGNWSSKVVANYAITRGQYHSSRSGDYAICAYVRPNYSGQSQTPTPCTTHTKGNYLWCELAHPHYNYFTCSVCGATFTDGTTDTLSSCAECTSAVGTTSAPRVSVDGQTVTLSWDYNGSGTNFDAYLIQAPWGWQDIKYHVSTQFRSCTFYNVVPGHYGSFIIARPNDDSVQSLNTEFDVPEPHTTHTWDSGVITKQPTFDSTGVKTYTCTVCGETKTETVERLDSITFRCEFGGAQLLLTRDGHLRVTDENGIIGYVTEGGGCYNRLKQAEWNGLHLVDYTDMVTSISFGEGITTLDSFCDFDIFPNLTTVELPQSLTTINNCAFSFCTSLQEISLPKNVSSLGGNAFQDCTSLRKISVSGQNTYYVRP